MSETNTIQSGNKMGIQPVRKLILTMGIPMICSMVVQALYNIIDSYFVSQIPKIADQAMNALTLAFPIQMLMVAVGVGTGVGVNALISRFLGQKEFETVNKTTGNAIFLGICTYIVFFLFGIFGLNAYLRSQSSNALVLHLGTQYLSICVFLSFGVILSMVYEKLLQSTGKTLQTTVAQLAGALTNIFLDPVLIFGWFGLPVMGISGAAYATVIGQMVTLALNMFFHYFYNPEIKNGVRYLKPQKDIILHIYQIGIPAIILQALMSFMTYGVNIILAGISENYVTAYGVYYKIQQFAFFAGFGLNNALIPLVAYNYGKGDKQRVRDSIKYGTLDTVILLGICMIVMEIFANPLASFFALSPEIIAICVQAMKIIVTGFLFAGVNIALQGIFQALGKGMYSLIVSLIRMVLVDLPLAWLFVRFASDPSLTFWAFPIAELCGAIVAWLMYRSVKKEIGL